MVDLNLEKLATQKLAYFEPGNLSWPQVLKSPNFFSVFERSSVRPYLSLSVIRRVGVVHLACLCVVQRGQYAGQPLEGLPLNVHCHVVNVSRPVMALLVHACGLDANGHILSASIEDVQHLLWTNTQLSDSRVGHKQHITRTGWRSYE